LEVGRKPYDFEEGKGMSSCVRCPKCGTEFDPDELLLPNSQTRKEQAEEIYKLYPRRVGKPAAMRAIQRALKGIPFVELKRRVAQLAVMWDNADKNFIANPATWFNQERFNDDPSTWMPRKQPERNGPPLFVQIQQLKKRIATHEANPDWIGYDERKVNEAKMTDLKCARALLTKLEAQEVKGL
jgi:hypothetical protein